jgi:hypothetical protein
MEEFLLTAKDKQDARIALLKSYSSQCVAHSVYVAALAFGFFSLVELARNFTIPLLSSELLRSIMLSLIHSGFVVLVVYVLGRTFFWGYLRAAVINVKPKKENEVERESERMTVTFMQQLHVACLDYVKERHKVCARFFALRPEHLALIWFDVFVAFLAIFLML